MVEGLSGQEMVSYRRLKDAPGEELSSIFLAVISVGISAAETARVTKAFENPWIGASCLLLFAVVSAFLDG